MNSRHPVVDAIVNQKNQMAQEKDIFMQLEINDLSGVVMPTELLVVLLTNLFDNALEACAKVEGRKEIRCRILLENSLYISVQNTSPPVQVDGEVIPTSKPESAQHGYGMPAIRYVLDRMQAEYTFDYEDGWFRFAAEIPMK